MSCQVFGGIFYFHGLPGSRLDASYLQNIALLNQYRLIGIDRPGMGLSSFAPKRTILSWPDDVEAIADSLNISKFSIIGHSGGAPFVAACAYRLPERLNGAAIVSGMAPFEHSEVTASLTRGQRFINKAIKVMPWVATVLMKITSFMIKRPTMLKQMLKQLPDVDRRVIENTDNDITFIDSVKEAFRQGVMGASFEIQLTLKPWGFRLEDINYPITIWQGGLDKQAPAAHANLYASLVPNAKLTFFKDEGHLSLLINQGENILRSICP
ncbi:MAG: alpha/beta hydrolase [Gammaproteobacteria bacterium]|nr:alpha/beta hydrolase [Gammaproteobacteria bacterium]